MEKVAIVVVDVQKDFVEGGSLAVKGGQQVADLILKEIRDVDPARVFYTKDWHIDPGTHFSDSPDYVDTWPRHCEAGTEGAEFAVDFNAAPDNIFYKGQYSASYSGVDGVNESGKTLVQALNDIEAVRVHVVGIAYDHCVVATALDIQEAGFATSVYTTFTVSVNSQNIGPVTDKLREKGIVVTM